MTSRPACHFLLSLFIAAFSAANPVKVVALDLSTRDAVRSCFNEVEARMDVSGPIRDASAEPGGLAWSISYVMHGYLLAYEATGDEVYVSKVTEIFDQLLALRDSTTGAADQIRNRVMPAWGTARYTKDKRYVWLVHAGMLTYPAAGLLRHAQENPKVRARLGSRIDLYRTAIDGIAEAFEPEWRETADERGFYYDPYLDRPLPLNQQNAWGRTLIEMARAYPGGPYREKAIRLARYFKEELRTTVTDAYDWSYWPGEKETDRSEDVSHAAINVDFAVMAYRDHLVFTKKEMERFVRTLTQRVWKGNGSVSNHVNGGGGADQYAFQIVRWGRLNTVDRSVDSVIRTFLANQNDLPATGITLIGLAHLLRSD